MKQSVRVFLGVVVCLIMSISCLMVAGITGRALLAAAPSGTGRVDRRPAGYVTRVWYGLACDSTGTHLIAAASDNYAGGGWIYTSVDGGATWTIRHPVANSQYWQCAASDADGSSLIAAVWDGRLYTSSNGGTDWTQRRPAGDISQRWITVASNADGSHLIAGASAGRLWISSNGGSTVSYTHLTLPTIY